MQEELYTTGQVAKQLGKTPDAIRKAAVKYNHIGRRVGRFWLFNVDDVMALQALPGPGRPWGARSTR